MLLVESNTTTNNDFSCIAILIELSCLQARQNKQQYNTTKQTIQRQTNNSPQEIKECVLQTINKPILFLFCYFILLSSLVLQPIFLGITGNTEVRML